MTSEAQKANNPPSWRKHGKNGRTPLSVKMLRFMFSRIGPLLPGLATKVGYYIWFRTHRFDEPAREARFRARAEECPLKVNNKEIAAWRWGQGPVVLLIHGWNGRGGQLGSYIDPLLKQGYQVITFDAPAHGLSPGKRTDIMEIRDVILAICQREGEIHAAIAHSFGGACLAAAISQGLHLSSAVCISVPGGFDSLMKSFTAALHIPDKVAARLKAKLIDYLGEEFWNEFSSGYQNKDKQQRSLIIHDRDDDLVDWREAEQLANIWPNSELILTDGLGHRRILRSPKLCRQIIDFIVETPIADSLENLETSK